MALYFLNCLTQIHCHRYCSNCSNPALQTATVHTVQCWQDFTWVKQWHPRHLNSCLFLHWEAAYTSTLLLPFTKVYKDPESLLTSGGKNTHTHTKTRLFLKLNVGAMSVSWCRATCSERARQRGWHLSLSHSFTHSLFSISPPLWLYFSFCD